MQCLHHLNYYQTFLKRSVNLNLYLARLPVALESLGKLSVFIVYHYDVTVLGNRVSDFGMSDPIVYHNYRPQRSWAMVILSQVCVCPRGGGWSGLQFFRGEGVLQFFGGVSNFSGGLQFLGGLQIFFSFFFQFLFPKKIPSGMHQPPPRRRRSMGGRYASYWNAFLLYCCV